MKFICPLCLYLPRKGKDKRISLSMNSYRNLHHRILSQSKRIFTEMMMDKYPNPKKVKTPCRVVFHIYLPNKRRTDIGNIRSVIEKYFCDWLVKAGVIEDDNYLFITETFTKFIEIDRANPRCEVILENI